MFHKIQTLDTMGFPFEIKPKYKIPYHHILIFETVAEQNRSRYKWRDQTQINCTGALTFG